MTPPPSTNQEEHDVSLPQDPQASGADPAQTVASRKTRKTNPHTYVVQVAETAGADVEVWTDIAIVTVEAREKRKAVIALALSDSGCQPAVGETLRVRVLDERSAAVLTVDVDQPEPQLRIG